MGRKHGWCLPRRDYRVKIKKLLVGKEQVTLAEVLRYLELPKTTSNQKIIAKTLRSVGLESAGSFIGGVAARCWRKPRKTIRSRDVNAYVTGKEYVTSAEVLQRLGITSNVSNQMKLGPILREFGWVSVTIYRRARRQAAQGTPLFLDGADSNKIGANREDAMREMQSSDT